MDKREKRETEKRSPPPPPSGLRSSDFQVHCVVAYRREKLPCILASVDASNALVVPTVVVIRGRNHKGELHQCVGRVRPHNHTGVPLIDLTFVDNEGTWEERLRSRLCQ